MKRLPYRSRRRHLPVVAFLACVSWLWSFTPASADQHFYININIEMKPQGYLMGNFSGFIITDKNLIFDTIEDRHPGSNGNPSTSRAMIFDKSGGNWKCQVFQQKNKRICVAIKVINAGRFLIDYSDEVDGIDNYRGQIQYFLNTTTADCQIELVSVRYTWSNKETVTTVGDNKSYCTSS